MDFNSSDGMSGSEASHDRVGISHTKLSSSKIPSRSHSSIKFSNSAEAHCHIAGFPEKRLQNGAKLSTNNNVKMIEKGHKLEENKENGIKDSIDKLHFEVPEPHDRIRTVSEVIVDPLCNPEHPKLLHFEDITSAAFKIKNGIINTPCGRSQLSDICGMEVYLKKDFLQVTGSFKERGARYALMMLPEDQKKKGVISASLGNHALALCYHGKQLNIPVTVVMPVIAPIMKVQSCRNLRANVIVKGGDMGEAKKIAMKLSKQENLPYINGYDHPHIMAGQGTIGLEMMEQVPDLEAVIIPVGGGGLIAGIATAIKAMKPHVQIIGVESDRCPSFQAAREAGKPVTVPILSTLADGLAVPTVGYNAFVTANSLIDKMVVVREEWVAISILRLVELEKCVVEGAGACGLAAILAGHLEELKGKKVVVLLCGGNIDTTILGRCLERGLAADGRLMKFTVCVSDRPGGIAELCRLLAGIGVSIKDMMHDRAWLTNDVFSVEVMVICETRDLQHSEELMDLLHKNYQKVSFAHIPNPEKEVT